MSFYVILCYIMVKGSQNRSSRAGTGTGTGNGKRETGNATHHGKTRCGLRARLVCRVSLGFAVCGVRRWSEERPAVIRHSPPHGARLKAWMTPQRPLDTKSGRHGPTSHQTNPNQSSGCGNKPHRRRAVSRKHQARPGRSSVRLEGIPQFSTNLFIS